MKTNDNYFLFKVDVTPYLEVISEVIEYSCIFLDNGIKASLIWLCSYTCYSGEQGRYGVSNTQTYFLQKEEKHGL